MGLKTEFLNLSHQRLLAFRDKHKGQRCVIIGNGPSLNQNITDADVRKIYHDADEAR